MARWTLWVAVAGAPPGYVIQEWPVGTNIADSAANAKAGDIVWPLLATVPNAAMYPLDAAAKAIWANAKSPYFNPWPFTGICPN